MPQIGEARQVHAVQPRVLVGEAQVHKALRGRAVGCRAGRHGARAAAAFGVDVVVHIAEVGGELDAPALTAGVVPVGGGAQRVGHLGLQVGVADVAVAIARHVDHAHGHPARGPGVALVQIGRARLVRKAEFIAGVGAGGVACQRGEVDVVVTALAVTRVEGLGLHGIAAVVALHRPTVGAHAAGAQSGLCEPLRAPARLPLCEQVQAVASAVTDVPERIWRHAATGRQPPVVQAVVLRLAPNTQGVTRRQGDLAAQLHARGLALGVHGHARHVVGSAVPELFVGAEVHAVAGALVVGPRLQLPPVKLALVAQVELLAVVARHVHALVGKVLVRDVLHPQAHFHQLRGIAQCIGQSVVARFVAAGAHFVAPQPLGRFVAGSGPGGLEGPRSLVVVRLRRRTVVAQAHLLGGIGGRGPGAAGVAVAAVVATQLALEQARLAGLGELRRRRLHLDRGANAVAPDAHWRDASEQAHAAHTRRVDVRQRRVHVVGARGNQVHAIHLDAQPVVRQPLHTGQAGHAACAHQAHAGQVAQQLCGVTVPGAPGLQAGGVGGTGAQRLGRGTRGRHIDGVQRPFLGASEQRQGGKKGTKRAQRKAARACRTGVPTVFTVHGKSKTKRGGPCSRGSEQRASTVTETRQKKIQANTQAKGGACAGGRS